MKSKLKKRVKRRKMADGTIFVYWELFSLIIRIHNSYRRDSNKSGSKSFSLSDAEFVTIEMVIV